MCTHGPLLRAPGESSRVVPLNQSKLIAQQAGAVKTKATTSCGEGVGTWTLATRTLDSYGHGPKSQTFEQHLRPPQWGRSKRTGCPSHPIPKPKLGPSLVINLITQKAHQMQQKAISSGGASASSPAILIPSALSLGFPFRSAAQY